MNTPFTVEATMPGHIADQLLRALILVEVATIQGRQRNVLPPAASEWMAASKALHDRLALAVLAAPEGGEITIELDECAQRAAYAAAGSALAVLDNHPADAATFGLDREAAESIRTVMAELRDICRQLVGTVMN